ncbi:MAG: DUF3810 domain-containing protein [Bacteroidales bacterium]|nr:DUF3810 domain-containing protein [Bacteroidales bacterium]
MTKKRKALLAISVLLVGLIELGKLSNDWIVYYNTRIYPVLMTIINPISSLMPVSIYDLFIFVAVVFLIYLIVCLFRKGKRIKGLTSLIIMGCVIYCCFYLEWGYNYFAPGFYAKNDIKYESYDSVRFDMFLKDYISKLNESYVDSVSVNEETMWADIKGRYSDVKDDFNLPNLPKGYKSKWMIFSDIYAKMGVKGYYGPFFFETHINRNLLKDEIPATAAHETAHLLGVTSEAEANFYSYIITTGSKDRDIRFSGYFSIMPYVISNARGVLSDNDFKNMVSLISPQVKQKYELKNKHWFSLYSPLIGNIQDWIYNIYLKGNNIPSGTANYSQVVGMIISYQDFIYKNEILNSVDVIKKRYPISTLKDLYKSFFQEKYGPGHLMGSKAKDYLLSEIEALKNDSLLNRKPENGYFEPTGLKGNFVRVDLNIVTDSIIPFDDFWNCFSQSMNDASMPDVRIWQNEWNIIVNTISERKSEFDNFESDSLEIDRNLKNGIFVGHHSKEYEQEYMPHYRIVSKEKFDYLYNNYIVNKQF